MARFDYLHDQGYDNLTTDVALPRERRKPRERTKVAPVMAKVGFWIGAITGICMGAGSGMRGRAAAVPGFLCGLVGAAILGFIGLICDGVASAAGD